MIVYALRCATGHGFEAWFRNSDTFDQQRDAKQIACPICGDSGVSKAPMAPRIGRSDRGGREPAPTQPSPPDTTVPAPTSPPPLAPEHIRPEHIQMVMSRIAELNQHIAKTCDYVGGAFPEEARKIHYGEAQRREIYGEASPADAAELREEGIEIASVPWIRRSDS